MMERLRLIAKEHGFSEEAVRALAELYDSLLPRIPTYRLGDGATAQGALTPLVNEDPERRYEDRGGIGVGGFSEVREVWDRHLGRCVARKVQLAVRSSPEDCARFREEVRITTRLQHPGVVPLHDWGELPDGRVWFTMKRVRGDTVDRRIAALHRLEGADFLRALRRLLDDFRRLCEPVAYAHAELVIHRDITPQNLMVGELGEVHVMDWGLARDLRRGAEADRPVISDPEPSRSSLSILDPRTRVAGTPFYMPPEQARGDIEAMSPASDVYALGAVLYEILSGRPPYMRPEEPREAPDRIVARVRAGSPAPIEDVARRETPGALHAICRKAMQRDPARRHAHAGELMEAVRDWLDGADRQARARQIVESAHRDHRARIDQMRRDADRRRTRSRELLDRLQSFDRAQDKAEAWKLADDAAAIEQEALREEINWTQKLRSALNDAPDLEEAHAALAAHYADNLLRAEAARDQPAATAYAALLEDHARKLPVDGRAHYEALLRGDGRVTLLTEPPHARVLIRPYEAVHRYLMTSDDKASVETAPVRELRMPRGSYLFLLSAPGFREVRYPVAVARGEHWDGIRPGSTEPHPIRLLREEELAPEDVYIPAGWFVAGGDPRAGEGMSRRRVWVDAFVIRKYPVTNLEYIEFLNRLVAEGRLDEARRHCPRQPPGATLKGDPVLAYVLDEQTGSYSMKAPELEGTRPVVHVDWHGAMAYARYMAVRTGLPWRLPGELEWEKAARGVDGRFMPWGDEVEPTWACVAGSHPDRKHVMAVHDYPTDVSPYGVRGLAGNVRDWCVERWRLDGPLVEDGVLRIEVAADDDDSERPLRGGAWLSAGDMTRLAVRYAERPARRHGVLGFRLARSLPG